MECYACQQPATRRCPRCGNAFCDEHGAGPVASSAQAASSTSGGPGQALCAACLDPTNGVPSGAVFRLTLFGLLGASVLALWLLLRPPSLPGESSAIVQPTLAPPVSTRGPSPPPPSGSPAPSPSPSVTATPGPTAPPTPTPEPPQPTPIEYVVQEGDSLSSIAAAYGVTAEDLAAVNGLSDTDVLHPGDVLVIPP